MNAAAAATPSWADLRIAGRALRIEYTWLAPQRRRAPLLIFLHEGLGSIAMWQNWPQALCDALQCRGLVYSRYGYGRSTPRPHDEQWRPDYLQQEAELTLPALLQALGVDTAQEPPLLFGHSDGGSIALLYAACYPATTGGIIVAAPHIHVEAMTLAGIRQARAAYQETDMRQRLARYHADPDSAFGAWNDTWLSPAFSDWNIEAQVAQIQCPVLAIQGVGDEYASLEQIRGIQRLAPQTTLLELQNCGHSPHKDQPDVVTAAVREFMQRLSGALAC